MVFCVGFIALSTLTTAVVTAIMRSTEHSTMVPHPCSMTSCMHVLQHPAFVYYSMPVSQYRTHYPVVLSIDLFAMVFYLPVLPMYCSILHGCITVSCMVVQQYPA